jgi:hypothetical protein
MGVVAILRRNHVWGLAPFHYLSAYHEVFVTMATRLGLDFVRGDFA